MQYIINGDDLIRVSDELLLELLVILIYLINYEEYYDYYNLLLVKV